MGNLCNLKLLAEYRWVTMVSKLVGKLMMLMASKGHFLGQIPQPIQRRSEMKAILESGATSIQSLPVRTTGQDFLHSCRHFYACGVRDRPYDVAMMPGECHTFGLHCRAEVSIRTTQSVCI